MFMDNIEVKTDLLSVIYLNAMFKKKSNKHGLKRSYQATEN